MRSTSIGKCYALCVPLCVIGTGARAMDRVCIEIRETVVTVEAEFRAERESLRITLPYLRCAISPPMATFAARIASFIFVHVARVHCVLDCEWCVVHLCCLSPSASVRTYADQWVSIDPRSVRNLECIHRFRYQIRPFCELCALACVRFVILFDQ